MKNKIKYALFRSDDESKNRIFLGIITSQILLDNKPPFIFICPLSSQSQEAYKHLHFKISARDKLKKSSYVLVEHFKSISSQRLHNNCLSVLTNNELKQITNTLTFMIN